MAHLFDALMARAGFLLFATKSKQSNTSKHFVLITVFRKHPMLELRNQKYRFQIRILPDFVSLEPASKFWKLMSRSNNIDILCFREHIKQVFKDFSLFLRSLSCIERSQRLAGRIVTIICRNPSPWRRVKGFSNPPGVGSQQACLGLSLAKPEEEVFFL